VKISSKRAFLCDFKGAKRQPNTPALLI